MMTTYEAADRWNCTASTVRTYCREGIVLCAEKNQYGIWVIPPNAPKPPMTRHGLCVLLDNLIQIQSGASLTLEIFGYDLTTLETAYYYLSDLGFLKDLDKSVPLDEAIKKAHLTQRGNDLMESNAQSRKKPRPEVTIEGQAGVNIGIAAAQVKAKRKQ